MVQLINSKESKLQTIQNSHRLVNWHKVQSNSHVHLIWVRMVLLVDIASTVLAKTFEIAASIVKKKKKSQFVMGGIRVFVGTFLAIGLLAMIVLPSYTDALVPRKCNK